MHTNRIRKIFHLGNTFFKIITFIYGVFVAKGKRQVININKIILLWD